MPRQHKLMGLIAIVALSALTTGCAGARTITRDFRHARGIPYRETNWLGAAAEVSRYFGEVTESARAIRREAMIGAAPMPETQKI